MANDELFRKYEEFGGSQHLGEYTSPEISTQEGRGLYRDFEGGSIYWTPQTGAHVMDKAVVTYWKSIGGAGNKDLEYPTSDPLYTADGQVYNIFQGGKAIYCDLQTGACSIGDPHTSPGTTMTYSRTVRISTPSSGRKSLIIVASIAVWIIVCSILWDKNGVLAVLSLLLGPLTAFILLHIFPDQKRY